MEKQHKYQPPVFLEQWLLQQTTLSPHTQSPHTAPPSAARAILQSWSDLRNDRSKLLPSLQTLLSSASSLHVADPHAKLLISLLSSSPPPPSIPPILRLLYIWTRKSSRPSPSLLQSAVETLIVIQIPDTCDLLLLLFGSLSALPNLPDASRSACLAAIVRLLEEVREGVGAAPEVLAGIGYSLSRCRSAEFVRKVAPLSMSFWGLGKRGSLEEGLMLMSLVEWVVGEWIKLKSLQEIDVLCESISGGRDGYARFSVFMCAAGVLRAFWRGSAVSGVVLSSKSRDMVDGAVFSVANFVVCRVGDGYELGYDQEMRLIARCVVLGLARCGPVPFNRDVMLCICLGLLNEVLPLGLFGVEKSDDGFLKVREHLDSLLFKEAGAVSGVLCNQYALGDEESRVIVENYIWKYCHEFYSQFHMASLVLKRRNEALLKELDKVAESIFLMVVVFASQVSKQKLDPKSSITVRSDASVRILIAFSCIEYLRRVRWPEYSDVVRRAVLTLQESDRASTSFVESMPSYSQLTKKYGGSLLDGMDYAWVADEVQTARLLFYLRVLPTCIIHIPASTFSKLVVPTMFLYMGHPNEKVSQASHSAFVAFMSSVAKESSLDDKTDLKEKLVFYYMERSLEGFPGVTPYEGMASGVVALVRHLPAGSPAVFYCTNCLVEKTTDMFDSAIRQDPDLWKNWDADVDPCKKILGLLLRLVSLVDIQVLPNMLKSLAQFISKLPKEGQVKVLDEMYGMVAESDDVIRKPTLVSWLQSLSYLYSQAPSSNKSSEASNKPELGKNKQDASMLSLDRTYSKL